MKKMLGLVLAVVMVLSMGGFALAYGPKFTDEKPYYEEEIEGYEKIKQAVLFTVYTQVELPCFLEVTLEGNLRKQTVISVADKWEHYDTYAGKSWYMTFANMDGKIGTPDEDPWLYDCGQWAHPIWNVTVKATDAWSLYILGGDLANEKGNHLIRIQYKYKPSGGSYSSYAPMAGGGEATPGSDGVLGYGGDTFATMHAQYIASSGSPTAGSRYYFKYRIPHTWETPQGYYEGITGYLVASFQ